MKAPRAPRLDDRRTADFAAELRERALAWIPTWGLADGEHDFGHALLEIAARFSSEVAERLDGSGDKMRRGFLDWLGVRGEAARPARLPVVFKLADAAREAVLAPAPARMQVDAGGTPVVFETETDLHVVPGRLEVVVGADPAYDAFYLPPPGLSDLQPLEPLPVQWQVKSFAPAEANRLQLDPELGLAVDMILEAAGQQYKIVQAEGDLVTIEPPLAADLPDTASVSKVTAFAPFDGKAHNWQAHALYLGDSDLLNVEADARIEVVGAMSLSGVTWQYWGKVDQGADPGWQPLTVAPQQTGSDALVLTKPKGAVEPFEINGRSSRWIRAFAPTVAPTDRPFTTEEFRIRINAADCAAGGADCPPDTETASPVPEGMANTTPLVLDSLFFPLGKEPRQFDAFYLGCQEAFSKKDAKVQLCFEMADRTFSTLAAVRDGTFENQVLAGVAKDRSLHLLGFNAATGSITKFRDDLPLQPPAPGYLGSPAPGNRVALDQQPGWRLPVWSEVDWFVFSGFLVATSAADTVWVWHENVFPNLSGWINFGKLPSVGVAAGSAVDGLVYLAGAPAKIAALRGGRLYVRDWPNGPEWIPANTLAGVDTIELKSIVPVLVPDGSGRLLTSDAAGMVGISDNKKLFRVSSSGVCTPILPAFDFVNSIRPVALDVGGLFVSAVKDGSPPTLVARQGALTEQAPLDAEVVAALEIARIGSDIHVLAALRDGTLVTWAPFATGLAGSLFKSTVSAGLVEGAPTAVAGQVVIPGAHADIFTNEFNPAHRVAKSANIESGIVVPESTLALDPGDLIVLSDTAGEPVAHTITQAGIKQGVEVFYPLDSAFPAGAGGPLLAYHLPPTLSGSFTSPDWTFDPSDRETEQGSWLLIGSDFFTVGPIDKSGTAWTAPVTSPSGGGPPAAGVGTYVRPIATGGRVAHFMRLDPTPTMNGDWDAALLARNQLRFPGKTPDMQWGKAFSVALGNRPIVVVLGALFNNSLLPPFEFLLDAALDEWRRDLGDTSTNPELSWEYWNGKGWWKLNVTLDETLNLKATGAVRFTAPRDIASSDWAGKTNYWVRARLIGGDYGREKVTIKTHVLPSGDTEQTVDRSSDGIRAPSALKLHISYMVCGGVQPMFVLTQDSGSIRDQSGANHTAGAIVEAFVPLAVTLGRLSNATAPPEAPDECPPECDCQSQASATVVTAAAATPASVTAVESAPALFIGVAGTLSGATVNVLLLIDERDHTLLAPMTVEALVAERFVPIVANDATRALGESGLLSMAFAVPPTPGELFGKTLTWIRLTPKAGANTADWKPSLRGVYLNAVWASATETLTRELVGSSEGAPNLTVQLARPPVLHHTLELRVKEPLGEEERNALRKIDKAQVLSEVDGLPGDWVLWKQVIDPSDEAAAARVYALDESNGEIRFGDGLHGYIPPIGSDSIVAFQYKRTEPGPPGSDTVPGNAIGARTALNLVSPVESVESVFAADHAAGGAPSEPDDRVLRFGFARLRHRNRAITLNDIEDLALQSSPDIVQARAITRQGYIRLVVVTRGRNPQPSAAQVRELRRYLLAAAPASLSATKALRIEGPEVRRLRLDLELRVETLDNAAALANFVKERLFRFFDTATGGVDEDGWALGANPSEDDIAFVLDNAPHLDSIKKVALRETAADGRERPWPVALKATELTMLADDAIRIQFETAEALV